MEKVRMGMIGTGAITELHWLGYENNPKVELVAIADVDEEVVKQRAEEWGVEKWYTDYKKILEDPTIDAVEVIVPHHLHAKIAIEAMEAGKHVSLQKPMAISIEECDAIIEASKRTGKTLRVFENFMYFPPLVKAKELLDSGAIGEPITMRMKCIQGVGGGKWEVPVRRWKWRFDPKQGGGGRVILDYGYHLFNVARWMMGDVEKVFSWITHKHVHEDIDPNWIVDSPAVVMWKYKDAERYGQYEATTSEELIVRAKWKRPEDEWFLITGTKGFIWVTQCTAELLSEPPLLMFRDGQMTAFNIDADWGTSFKLGVSDFINAIIEKRQPPITGEEGRRVLQFCKAIEKSAEEGREVTLDEIK